MCKSGVGNWHSAHGGAEPGSRHRDSSGYMASLDMRAEAGTPIADDQGQAPPTRCRRRPVASLPWERVRARDRR
jgi:hypothetical protein